MQMPKRLAGIGLAVCLAAIIAGPAHAEPRTITVSVVGEAEVQPDLLEVSGTLSENSEKLKDAVTAFRDTHRRALKSIDALKIEHLRVRTGELALSLAGKTPAQNPWGGVNNGGEPAPPGSLTIRQRVTLTVGRIDQLDQAELIDLAVKVMAGARDAGIEQAVMDQQAMMRMQFGMASGPAGSAVFKLSDPAAARKQATRDAMDKARADAGELAELADARLGRVISITDHNSAPSDNPYQAIYGLQPEDNQGVSAQSLKPIRVTRSLSVTFQLITD